MRARLVCSLLLLLALAFPALAQDRRGGLDRVLPQIRRTVPGTFYDAEGPFFTPDGRAMYRIKWMLPDGRIIWLNVDAQSGQVIGGMPPIGQSTHRFQEDDRRNNWGQGSWGNGGGDRGGWGRGGGNWGDRGGGDRGSGDRGGGDRGWGQGGHGNDRGGGDHNGNRGGRDRRGGG